MITITDDADANCTFVLAIINLGSCSTMYNIDSSGLANFLCSDNDTKSNNSNDLITIDRNLSGNNLGFTYSVFLPAGSITLSEAPYGLLGNTYTNKRINKGKTTHRIYFRTSPELFNCRM